MLSVVHLLFPNFHLQVSCASSSAELSNRTRFRNYFQLLPTDADLAYGFFGIITRFKWNRVAIILQEERLFQVVSAPNGHLISLTVMSRAIKLGQVPMYHISRGQCS